MPLPFDRLILATTNPYKVMELSDLLKPLEVELKSLADWPAVVAVDEDGVTPAENARKKAVGYARQLSEWVLADDTALCVDALGGEPGVKSARYAGERATMDQNRALLLERLATVPDALRTARFVCHLVIANPDGEVVWEVAGKCEGRILRGPSRSTRCRRLAGHRRRLRTGWSPTPRSTVIFAMVTNLDCPSAHSGRPNACHRPSGWFS